MKKLSLLCFSLIWTVSVLAQVPRAIKYQAVARDANGTVLSNQNIVLRISILADQVTGPVVYCETHSTLTNQFGLVSLEIGNGSVVSGAFSAIQWRNGTFFIKVEIDETLSGNFQFMGTSQFLSVPYALYAGEASLPAMTEAQRDALVNPGEGYIILNLTSGCLNIRRNSSWDDICPSPCMPQPTPAEAGSDQYYNDTTTHILLEANIPVNGTGLWTIFSGSGGLVADPVQPNSTFAGSPCTSYVLVWSISTNCGTSSDSVNIIFDETVTPAEAGNDQQVYGSVSTTLEGNIPAVGDGTWSLISGSGGSFSGLADPHAGFTGVSGSTYLLRWTITGHCDFSSDSVEITFCPALTIADAGPDQYVNPGTATVLAANAPGAGNSGLWTLVGGDISGLIADPTDPGSAFSGLQDSAYVLRWTISTICDTSYDEVTVHFITSAACGSNINYGGQVYHTIQIGTQCWMKENMNIGTMVISVYTGPWHSECSDNGIIEKFCLGNDPANCEIYGGLYDWDEMMQYTTSPGVQGICPAGWHIPADIEWCTLTSFLDPSVDCGAGGWSGTDVGGKMKETGFEHWCEPNSGATNQSGFTALGSGARYAYGNFVPAMFTTYFWSSTEYSSTHALMRELDYSHANIFRDYHVKQNGWAVRCLKDTCLSGTTSDAGPDQLDLQGTTATMAANDPGPGETGTWNIVSGNGGNFMDNHSPSSDFNGTPGTEYVLTWTIENDCHTSIDSVNISFAAVIAPPCPGIASFEYGGQTYNTVQIGTQCWMKENLNIGSMVNSGQVPVNDGIVEKYCYNNVSDSCGIYGGLYAWNEMMRYNNMPGIQGICPEGWHLPEDGEWTVLIDYLGGSQVAGGKLKETGTTHWYEPNNGATNESGFTALGAGYNNSNGTSYYNGYSAYFWSSSKFNTSDAYYYRLENSSPNATRSYFSTEHRLSVRCIKDTCTSSSSSDAGPDQLNLPGTAATMDANTPGPGETGTWNIVSGNGGNFMDNHSPSSDFNGTPGTEYVLTWTIANDCHTSIDSVNISFAAVIAPPCPGIASFEYGGQTYYTVQIGTQCWMKENLNIGTMINGSQTTTDNGIIEKYCYNDLPDSCNIYGGLYNWDETMQYTTVEGARGICPSGWHVPEVSEWTLLSDYLGGLSVAGGKLKEAGYAHWNSPNTDATNESGFTALGAGYCSSSGVFNQLKVYGYSWSSSETSLTQAYRNLEAYNSASVTLNASNKANRFPVRCLRDTCVSNSTSDAGPDQLNLPGISAVLAANAPGPGETGTWEVVSGTGGSFTDIHSPTSTFNGTGGIEYSLTWTLANDCHISRDSVKLSFATGMGQPCPGIASFEYEGQTYHTVQIGTQCWMKENLNVGNMINGYQNMLDNGVIEKYCYHSIPDSCTIYGGLYSWNEMMQYVTTENARGICPAGWHIPSNAAWTVLTDYLGGNSLAGGLMKESGLLHWNSPNEGATNASGFTGLPGGRSLSLGSFYAIRNYGFWWSSSESSTSNAWDRYVGTLNTEVNAYGETKTYSLSVRCLKD